MDAAREGDPAKLEKPEVGFPLEFILRPRFARTGGCAPLVRCRYQLPHKGEGKGIKCASSSPAATFVRPHRTERFISLHDVKRATLRSLHRKRFAVKANSWATWFAHSLPEKRRFVAVTPSRACDTALFARTRRGRDGTAAV
jgi:hypothetical protein